MFTAYSGLSGQWTKEKGDCWGSVVHSPQDSAEVTMNVYWLSLSEAGAGPAIIAAITADG